MNTQRTTLLALLLTMCLGMSHAFKTQGNGTAYTFKTLSQTEGSGVTQVDDHTFVVADDVTIAEGDKFTLKEDYAAGMTVRFGDKVTLTFEGETVLYPPVEEMVTFTRDKEDDTPYGIKLTGGNMESSVSVADIRFEYLGLMNYSQSTVNIDRCEFYYHNGAQSGALFLASTTALTTVSDCTFSLCSKAAIGGAANYSCSLWVYNSIFRQNSQNNQNIPQLNLTAASNINIDGCTIEGDPSKNMVGGIGVSNFVGLTDTWLQVVGCKITDNRYGIGTVGPIDNVRIAQNTLVDNCHESNPMNGGSGISLYDPYQQTKAIISGNHIEGSLWGVTIIGCKDVNLGQPGDIYAESPGGNVFKNNGNGGQLYDLYNNSTLTVYAQNNTWNVAEQTQEQIETVVFHKADNDKLGEVIYWPAAADTGIGQQPTANSQQSTAIYSLDGIRRTTPRKGLNIVHGQKVVY